MPPARPNPGQIHAALRVSRVRRDAGRGMTAGLVWVEVYLPLDVAAFAQFTALTIEKGSAEAAADADPELAKRALTPIDTHGEAMFADHVQEIAHQYMLHSQEMDAMHDERARDSLKIVESFVNGPEIESPHFWPGAWVIVFQVAEGSKEWSDIEKGVLNAVSFQAYVTKVPIVGEIAA